MEKFIGMKSTSSEIRQKELWAFDTEDNSKGTVKQICVYNGEKFFHFKDTEKFRNWLYTMADKSRYFIATNLEYDLINCFGCRWDLLRTRLKAEGRIIVSSAMKGTRVIFYDSLNHWKASVKAMGEQLGLPKLEMNLKSWEYVERDTEITWKYASLMQERYNKLGANFNATLPSSSLDLFRRNYLSFAVKQPKEEILKKLFLGYYGGRVEVFNTSPHTGDIYYIDVNSMYPYVMTFPYPNPNNFKVKIKPDLSLMGVCACEIEIPKELYFGPLPYRTDRLIFPVGKLKGVWTYEEIRECIKRGGRILRYHWCIEFNDACYPFLQFVNALYKVKSTTKDSIEKEAAKVFMNSLYGKMGEKIDEVEMMLWRDVPAGQEAQVYGDFAYVKNGERYPAHCNAIWAVYTTSYARLFLLNALETLRANGNTVLYCDTDSIIYKGRVSSVSNKIGEWKLEGKYDLAHFLAPKMYSLSIAGKRIVKVKGVPRDLAYQFFDEGSCTFSKPLRLRQILARGLPANLWVETSRVRRGYYTKRKVLDTGETKALVLR